MIIQYPYIESTQVLFNILRFKDMSRYMETIKTEVVDYWTKRAENFASLRLAELKSEKRELWTQEILQYLPQDKPLHILDVGTGSGFFSMILSAMGHKVVGIDLTAEMIDAAKETAKMLELPAEFYVMDAEQPDFPDESFDVVLSRNLTWTLPHLKTAYARWHQVLKPGGILLNFDADYCREQPMPKQDLPVHHAHQSIAKECIQLYEQIKAELISGQQARPTWDVALLEEVGFQDITVDTTPSERLYRTVDEFYNPTPIFSIYAVR